jgi:SAM-dependent methyltransferase
VKSGNSEIEKEVLRGFGREWRTYDQSHLSDNEKGSIFKQYFAVFPWDMLPEGAVGADIGCGSGRWATLVAPRVGRLHLLDASDEALSVARRNLDGFDNVDFHLASANSLPFENGSLDFAYSLGVLHHVVDTMGALRQVHEKLRHNAPFLVYLYYDMENRPFWYRLMWRASDCMRRIISRLPFLFRNMLCTVIAALLYWPVARLGALAEMLGAKTANWPLAYYRDKSFYLMRTCSLDRFGTILEKRYKRVEIESMLSEAGFVDIRFSDSPPYWCAVGFKR